MLKRRRKSQRRRIRELTRSEMQQRERAVAAELEADQLRRVPDPQYISDPRLTREEAEALVRPAVLNDEDQHRGEAESRGRSKLRAALSAPEHKHTALFDRSVGGAASPRHVSVSLEEGGDDFKELGTEGHRVVLEFEGDGSPSLKLLHPESGCEPATQCALCGRMEESESKPCYDCKEGFDPDCWLTDWFNNHGADELLHGKVTLAFTPQIENSLLKVTLNQPVPGDGNRSSEEEAAACICGGDGEGPVPTTVGAEHGERVATCPKCGGGKGPLSEVINHIERVASEWDNRMRTADDEPRYSAKDLAGERRLAHEADAGYLRLAAAASTQQAVPGDANNPTNRTDKEPGDGEGSAYDEERDTDAPARCPDDGACHHACGPGECWRVHNALPLSEYSEEWPPEIVTASAERRLAPPSPETKDQEDEG